MLLDVVSVEPLDDYKLLLGFENGERRIFDVSPFLRPGTVFERLRDPAVFGAAHVATGTVVWPGEVDIDPETLYDRSIPL